MDTHCERSGDVVNLCAVGQATGRRPGANRIDLIYGDPSGSLAAVPGRDGSLCLAHRAMHASSHGLLHWIKKYLVILIE